MAVPLWTAKQMLKYLRGRYNKIEIVGIKKKKTGAQYKPK